MLRHRREESWTDLVDSVFISQQGYGILLVTTVISLMKDCIVHKERGLQFHWLMFTSAVKNHKNIG